MLDLLFLADASPSSDASLLKTILPWATTFAVAVIGAVLRNQAKRDGEAVGEAAGKAQAMQITNNPLVVEMKEQFVTRREFERLEASVNTTVTKMEGLFAQTMQAIEAQGRSTERRIENQNKRLTTFVESVAKAANDGRGKLWKVVNANSNELAALSATTNVAAEIGKLADAVNAKASVERQLS